MRRLLAVFILFLFASCGSERNSVMINDDKLYFDKSVSSDEAMTVLKWMKTVGHNWGQPKMDFQLSKKNDNYLFQYPVQIEDAEKSDGNIRFIQMFADKMSSDALNGKTVVVRLTDKDWKKEKKLITSNSGGNLNN